MSEREEAPPWGAMLFLSVIAFTFGGVVGGLLSEHAYRREAVKVGVAEWVADSDGKPKFVWIIDRRRESEAKP